MESYLAKSGDWQGTAIVPASDTLAFFAFSGADGGNYETWTETIIAWVMAQNPGPGNRPAPSSTAWPSFRSAASKCTADLKRARSATMSADA